MNSDDDDDVPTLIVHEDSQPVQFTPSVQPRVPLTIICGFLGAGKSTLLKRILTEKHGYRIAVIMNEFGDTADIEARAINVSSPDDPTAESSEEFLELANGCLCCSIKDSGVAAIEKLMQRRGAFDYILLETTGLADPGPIASMFWLNEEYAAELGRDIALDGVICVVDAVFGKQQLEEDQQVETIGESIRQVASSDVIILNKTDLVSPTLATETHNLISQINPAAPVHHTVRGEIDLKHIIGISAYASPPNFDTSSQQATRKNADHEHQHDATDTDDHNHDHGHSHDHDHDEPGRPTTATHYEARGISSLQVVFPRLRDAQVMDRFDAWIRSVLWESRIPEWEANTNPVSGGGKENGEEGITKPKASLQVLRCKGVFELENGEEYVLQGVREMYEISKMEAVKEERGDEVIGVPSVGKVVLIGKGLNDEVRASLEKVLVSSM